MPEIISAAYHRNGVTGEGFFVGIVADLFEGFGGYTFMVTHVPDTDEEKAVEGFVPNTKTFVVCTDVLPDVRFGINSWRGGDIPQKVIDDIKNAARANNYEGTLKEIA